MMIKTKGIKVNTTKLAIMGIVMISLLSISTIVTTGYSSYGVFEGDLNGSCDPCHPPGDFTSLTDYGIDFAAETDHASDPTGAINAIMGMDSDGDGFFNRNEIENGSNPGDANDIPSGKPKLPHLEIDKLDRSAKQSYEGENLYIYVFINNTGDGDARDVNITLLDDDEVIQELEGIYIKKGESRYVIFDIVAKEGIHKYQIEAEYYNGTELASIFVFTDDPPTDWLQDGLPNPLPAPGALTILITFVGLATILRWTNKRRGA